MVYGYACNETKELMPMPIMVAHKLMKKYDEFRRKGEDFFADAKTQVSILYEDDKPVQFDCIIISVSHSAKIQWQEVKEIIEKEVLKPILQEYSSFYVKNSKILQLLRKIKESLYM